VNKSKITKKRNEERTGADIDQNFRRQKFSSERKIFDMLRRVTTV
jgi:hypothetical protein